MSMSQYSQSVTTICKMSKDKPGVQVCKSTTRRRYYDPDTKQHVSASLQLVGRRKRLRSASTLFHPLKS